MTAPIHELPQHTAESLKNLPKPKPLDNFNPKASVKLPSVVRLDIQSLFDTRLAALTLFAKEEALELCVSGRYFRREKDSFEFKAGLFSAEDLRRIRQAGRRDLLTNSQMTAIPSFLRQITDRYKQMSASTPYVKSVEIQINTHPYTLSERQCEVIRRCLHEMHAIEVPVFFIKKAIPDLTPGFIRENCLCVIMYDYVQWCNHLDHHLEIVKRPFKNIAFYVPELVMRDLNAQEQEMLRTHGQKSIFEFCRLLFEQVLPYQYLGAAYFSADLPTNPVSVRYRSKPKTK